MKVLDFTQKMEEFGKKYLSTLAEGASYQGVRTVLKMLAEEQQEVVDKVAALRQVERDRESSELDSVEGGFKTIFNVQRPLTSDLDVYSFGVQLEERVTSLFEQAAQAERDDEARQVLLRVAEEERKHLEAWKELYDYITAPARTVACAEFLHDSER